jgi:hypothetical protein
VPTGRANARPTTGSATKQSTLSFVAAWIASLALAITATQANWLFENRIRSLMNEAIRNDRDVDIGFRVHSPGPRI